MKLLTIVIGIYMSIFLLFFNCSLFLCNDEKYCMFPVNSVSLRTHFVYQLRNFYSNNFISLTQTLIIANIVLYIEIISLAYFLLCLARKHIKKILKILGLMLIILLAVYHYTEYQRNPQKQSWIH